VRARLKFTEEAKKLLLPNDLRNMTDVKRWRNVKTGPGYFQVDLTRNCGVHGFIRHGYGDAQEGKRKKRFLKKIYSHIIRC
jgi:hypothetical protein